MTGAAAARVIVHGARKCDVDGEADAFWAAFDGDRIAGAGTGAGWVAHAGPDTDWARFALGLGYYDQAHFVRDFRALVGRTPAQYERERR